jgi:hypothetical protein
MINAATCGVARRRRAHVGCLLHRQQILFFQDFKYRACRESAFSHVGTRTSFPSILSRLARMLTKQVANIKKRAAPLTAL